ncbi:MULTISPECIES: hypothetical protein [Aeromonas]|uniref:hypothetical protein n=1 Tax=Aeromonas TaxID=642 RepID=UPI000B10AA67|nr:MULTISPECIES: hypothetical protein [Aeromonas]HAU4888423.1 hypothetical protein [Aeromonas hydrophila]HAU4928758.1 hypothetical protein [Aeromonas hydrophila]
MTVDEAIDSFRRRKNNIACNGKGGLLLTLESLGFGHKDGKVKGHRVFWHDDLSAMTGTIVQLTVDCGHLPTREMKLPYVVKVIRFLETNKVELEQILQAKEGEKNDKS